MTRSTAPRLHAALLQIRAQLQKRGERPSRTSFKRGLNQVSSRVEDLWALPPLLMAYTKAGGSSLSKPFVDHSAGMRVLNGHVASIILN